jgi:hypothetical protein
MSKSNYDKPFYVDVGTSIAAIRCASNNDVIIRLDRSKSPIVLEYIKKVCDRMNKEAKKPLRNCDVGSPEEQECRFVKFCDKYLDNCSDCPLHKQVCDCPFVWLQMPYEEV